MSSKSGSFELGQGELLLGRSRSCQLVLPDPSISRSHVLLIVEGNEVQVKDLDSSNGTYVNGKLIQEETVLEVGDRLTVGETELKLEDLDASSTAAATPSPVLLPKLDLPAEGPTRTAAGVGLLPDDDDFGREVIQEAFRRLAPQEDQDEPEEDEGEGTSIGLPVVAEQPPAEQPPASPDQSSGKSPEKAASENVTASSGVLREPSFSQVSPAEAGFETPSEAPPSSLEQSPKQSPKQPPKQPAKQSSAAASAPPSKGQAPEPQAEAGAGGELLPSLDDLDDLGSMPPRPSEAPGAAQSGGSATAPRKPVTTAAASKPRGDFPPAAGFWVRAGAGFLDWMLILVVSGAVSLLGGGPWQAQGSTLFSASAFALAVLVPVFGWSIWGTTPGKRLFSLYVLSVDHSSTIGVGRALLRFAGYFVSLLALGVGFLMIGFTGARRGLHDVIAGTYVARRD
ncbi:MAG: RDD family protein [Acidobacteriota bacterium]|nr:RDD family protein [Acidobacteriota bacterium]